MSKLKTQKYVNLTSAECHAVVSMFSLYDYECTGYIPSYLAEKLIATLGFDLNQLSIKFNKIVSISELLHILDQIMPPSDPVLNSSLTSFNGLIAKQQKKYQLKQIRNNLDDEIFIPISNDISPNDISEFMESLGRPPASNSEASSVLNAMLDFDDCSINPTLKLDTFNKEMLNFVKKTNALKDFK